MSHESEDAAWGMVEALAAMGLVVPPLGSVAPATLRRPHDFQWVNRDVDIATLYAFMLDTVADDIAEHGATYVFAPVRNSLIWMSTAPSGNVVVWWQGRFGSTYTGVTDGDVDYVNSVFKRVARAWAAEESTTAPTGAVRWLVYQQFGRTGYIDLDEVRAGVGIDDAHHETGSADDANDANDLLVAVLESCATAPQEMQTHLEPESTPQSEANELRSAVSPRDSSDKLSAGAPPIGGIVPQLAEALRRLADDSHLVISVHGSIRYVQFATFRPNLRLETIGTRYLDDVGEAWSVDEVVWLADHDWHDADDDGNLWRDWIPADETAAAQAAIDALINVHGVTSLDQVWFQSEDDDALAALDVAFSEDLPTEPLPQIPAGAKIVAVIDYVAKNSVLEVLALTDTMVLRRHCGLWYPDAEWRNALPKAPARSIRALSQEEFDRVRPMVDYSTRDAEWQPLRTGNLEMYWPSHRPGDPDLYDWGSLADLPSLDDIPAPVPERNPRLPAPTHPPATPKERAAINAMVRALMAKDAEGVDHRRSSESRPAIPPAPVQSPGAELVGTLTHRFDDSGLSVEFRLWTDGTVAARRRSPAETRAEEDVSSPMPIRFSWWATSLFRLAGLAPTVEEVAGLAAGFANDVYPDWAPTALRGGPEVRLLAAEDPACPHELLAVLARDRNERVREAVAEHPTCPAELLPVLAADEGRRVRRRVARHPSCPSELLAGLVRDDDRSVSRAAISNPHFPHDVLRRFARSKSASRRSSVALNPTCPVELLTALAGDEDKRPREWVARHAACPAETLAVLAEDAHEEVRAGVARNPSCPVDLLLDLDRDDSWKVREGTAQHPSYPVELLAVLAEDPSPKVRKSVAMHPYCPVQLLSRLSRDEHAEVRTAVAEHAACPAEPLAALAQDEQWEVREAAAKHPACPIELLPALAGDGEEWVRVGVAEHRDCPFELLAVLAEDASAAVREAAAQHPSCPPSVLTVLAADDSVHVRKAARGNPGFVA